MSQYAYVGVNIEGLDWFPVQPPMASAIEYYLSKGLTGFRLPISWELLQPTLYGPLDPAIIGYVDAVVSQIAARPGTRVVLDLHNYMRYQNDIVGQSDTVYAGHFADVWMKLSQRYASNASVFCGLMNEPHDVDDATLSASLNAAIVAIRKVSSTINILVPASDWCNGQRYVTDGNTTIAQSLLSTQGLILEVHQYLDVDGAGQSPIAVHGAGRWLDGVTAWARQNGHLLWLGETACGSDAASMTEMAAIISTVRASSNWVGLSWWSSLGGHPDPDMRWYNLDPLSGQDRPQMGLLTSS